MSRRTQKVAQPPAEDIVLGLTYKDTHSGFQGICAAKIEYLNGCIRYEISGADKDGLPKGYVFDEQQLELVPDAPTAIVPEPVRTGGDPSGASVVSNASLR